MVGNREIKESSEQQVQSQRIPKSYVHKCKYRGKNGRESELDGYIKEKLNIK